MKTSTLNALCIECRQKVPAEYRWISEQLFLEKTCATHGVQRTLISRDKAYQEQIEKLSATVNPSCTPMMVFLEVIDECDLGCRTCIAGSLAGAGNARDPDQLVSRVAAYVAEHGRPQLLLLTGGEPALHDGLLSIIKNISPLVDQLVLITNGVRIANDAAFAQQLSQADRNLHVYLQFDSLRSDALVEIRGRDLKEVRLQAVANLGAVGVATTLVSVVKRGVNDQDIVETVEFALNHPHILGVTFQPIRASGRHSSFDPVSHSILLTDIRNCVTSGIGIDQDCIRPHPADPNRVSIGYFCRASRTSLTGKAIDANTSGSLPLYLSPSIHAVVFDIQSALRVTIISYYDQYDVTVGDDRPKGIVFLVDDGSTITLEDRYLFSQLPDPKPQPIFIQRKL